MYNLFKDALFVPKNLLKYRNKSGLFVFFYLTLLALVVSIGGAIRFIGYQGNSVLTAETTGCSFVAGSLVCDGANYDETDTHALFGMVVYFLPETADPATLTEVNRMVFQGSRLVLFSEGVQTLDEDISAVVATITFDEFFATLTLWIRIAGILVTFFGNLITLLVVSLLATLPFLRLKKFVSYKKIFKLVLFAMTPFAVLLTFYNLVDINDIFFLILMLVAYRSVFVLQRELTMETYLHLNDLAAKEPPAEVVETQQPAADDEEEGPSDENDQTGRPDHPDDDGPDDPE